MLLIITSSGEGLFRFVNIDHLETTLNPQKVVLVNFYRNFWQQRTFQQ